MSGNVSQVGAVQRLTEPIGEDDTDTAPTQSAAVEPRLSIALRAADIVGVWDGDLVAGLVYGDSNFARIYGVDPAAAARGVPRGGYFKNIHPDDLPEVQAEIARMFAGATEYANEHRIMRSDGELRWVLTRGRLLRDTNGQPVRFAGISVDITERRRAEARQAFLLELADRLRTRADGASIVDEAVSRLARHLGASRAGYARVLDDDATIAVETCYADGIGRLSGAFPLAHFGQSNVARHRQGLTIAHDDLAADGAGDAPAFASGEIRAFVSVPLFRDGRLSATLFVSHREPRAWRPEDVALIEHVAARLRDALERVHAEEALRRLNASLEAQVEERTRDRDRTWRLAPVVIVVADSRGTLLEANPAWTRVLGWSREETIGQDVMNFVAPEDQAAGAAGMARLFQGLPVDEYQLTFLTRSGERRSIVWTTVPDGDRLYGHGRDVTEQVRAEERLRQAQKMEAVGQLTGGLAHDFNNLLTGIAGGLELLATRVAQGRFAELDRYIGVARDATRRGAALTQRLLAFSRRQPLDPKVTDVNRLVAGMAELIQRTVGPALVLELVAAPDPWVTLVDPHQLENALLNLCINARDAMPDGGRLSIATANRDLSEAEARDLDLAAGQYLVLSVTDTGAGMTPDVMRRAFDPFFTTKPLGAGTGLGLSMVYGFARQSGGAARIRSEAGLGTSVAILLPRCFGVDETGETSRPVGVTARGGLGKTVLVVDDEPNLRMLVLEVLGELGYRAIAAEDGAGALAVLRSDAGIDLMVTDVGLPGGLNGRQVADAARVIRPGLPVLFVTGYAAGEAVGDGDLEPGMRVMTKPFALDALAERIREMIAATGS